MSRMELERQLCRDQGVCSSVATVDLPLGPLNRLEIQKNAFLEAYLAIMTYTTALEPTEEVLFPCNVTAIPRDPLAAIDESYGDPNRLETIYMLQKKCISYFILTAIESLE